jgi:hypothetical protein
MKITEEPQIVIDFSQEIQKEQAENPALDARVQEALIQLNKDKAEAAKVAGLQKQIEKQGALILTLLSIVNRPGCTYRRFAAVQTALQKFLEEPTETERAFSQNFKSRP